MQAGSKLPNEHTFAVSCQVVQGLLCEQEDFMTALCHGGTRLCAGAEAEAFLKAYVDLVASDAAAADMQWQHAGPRYGQAFSACIPVD